jgi:succinate dehydrogenase / fumarate reductase cytochrome b subunit
MYTMVLSISHRITGIFLSVGLVLFVYWLSALASGAAAYGVAVERLRSPLMQLLLLGWLFSFFFHLANGIRHLAWDCGFGYERRQARASGWAVFIAAVLLTLLCVAWVLRMQGASA